MGAEHVEATRRLTVTSIEGAEHSRESCAGAGLSWRQAIPVLHGPGVTLRELEARDAASLFAMVTTGEVTRFIWPPPTRMEGFERFIAWSQRQRAAGTYVCLAIVPDGCDTAVGLFQLRTLEFGGFGTAEWGFALGSAYWGTGLFTAAADAVLTFAFEELGVHRLEARAAVLNGRGNAALRKVGAVPEGVLRRSFLRDGEYLDQILWSILACDWKRAKDRRLPAVH